jgi:hypothetical protein
MMDGIFCHDIFGFVVIVAAGVQVTDKSWEITAGYLQADSMTFIE